MFRQGGCKVDDSVIPGLHLDQKPFQTLWWQTTHKRTQLDQSFGIGGEGKSTHLFFETIVFEIIPSFDNSSNRSQTSHQYDVFQNGTHDRSNGHQQQGQPVEQSIATFEMIQHIIVTPPLFVVESIQRVHALQ